MDEAYLKSRLRDAIREEMPIVVVRAHQDKYSSGVPDLSVTWRGTTSWVEVKYSRAGRRSRPTELQRKALEDLARAGAPAYVVEYREGPTTRVIEVTRFSDGRSELIECHGKPFGHREVARALREEHERRMRDHDKVLDFMAKFGIPMASRPTRDDAVLNRRLSHLEEEMSELLRAYETGDLPGAADALVDLVYVAIGAALELGVPWAEVFDRVHRANMRKVRVDDGHGHKLGIAKPEGWQPPDVGGALRDARGIIDETGGEG